MKKVKQKIKTILPKIIGEVNYLLFLNKIGKRDLNSNYDAFTEIILKKVLKNTSVCVDVGCHAGSILKMMMKYAPNGKFYAFEPIPKFVEYLQKNYDHHSNVLIYEIALSDVTGEASFNHVTTNPGYSGLIKRSYDRPDEKETKINVKTDLMDNIIQNDSIDFIKIDVEGAELQVLRGAKEIVKRDKPFIVFEHGLGAADYYGTKPEDIYELLHDYCGLNLNLMDRYLKNRKPLSKKEFCKQFYDHLNYYFLAYPDQA